MRMYHWTGPKIVYRLSYVVHKVKNPDYSHENGSHVYNEILYVDGGRLWMTTESRSFAVNTGECAFIPSWGKHEFRSASDDEPLSFLNIAYRGVLPKELVNAAPRPDERARDALLRLKELSLPPMNDLKAEIASCALTEFILRMCLQLSAPSLPLTSPSVNRRRYRSELVNKALNIINERHVEPLRLDEVADELGVSASNLRALFRNETKASFTHHLQAARVEAAKELLYRGTDNVDQIANKVGYHSLPAFFKVFRRFTDTTPMEFTKTLGTPEERPELGIPGS